MGTMAAGFAPAPQSQIRDRKMGSLHVLTKNGRGANLARMKIGPRLRCCPPVADSEDVREESLWHCAVFVQSDVYLMSAGHLHRFDLWRPSKTRLLLFSALGLPWPRSHAVECE